MIAALLLLLVGLALTAAIIAAGGFFVAQEFAYMSVDRARLRTLAENGDAAAMRALAITRRTSFMLSGAQLGITVTGLMVGYVAEPFIGESIGALLGFAGVPAAVGITVGTVGALLLATLVQMIFGELFPKNLAIANPEPLARALARPTQVYLGAFGWLVRAFDAASNAILRVLRVEPVHDVDSSATAEDLGHIIDDSRASGDLSPELSLLLDRVLDFPERDAAHAMMPRVRVDVVGPEANVADVRSLMATGHTRYPVLGEHGEPLGVVHLVDVLGAGGADAEASVTRVMRAPVVVPEVMKLREVLGLLTERREQLACVIDEYGGLAGILTIEDLAEEVVGEITDEHDRTQGPAPLGIEHAGGLVWFAPGDAPLDEIERVIGRELPRGESETLGGLLIATAGALLQPGDQVSVTLSVTGREVLEGEARPWQLRAEVREVQRHVPSLVRIALVRADAGERDAHDRARGQGERGQGGADAASDTATGSATEATR